MLWAEHKTVYQCELITGAVNRDVRPLALQALVTFNYCGAKNLVSLWIKPESITIQLEACGENFRCNVFFFCNILQTMILIVAIDWDHEGINTRLIKLYPAHNTSTKKKKVVGVPFNGV